MPMNKRINIKSPATKSMFPNIMIPHLSFIVYYIPLKPPKENNIKISRYIINGDKNKAKLMKKKIIGAADPLPFPSF